MRILGYRTWVVTVPMTDTAVRAAMSTYVLLQIETDAGIDGVAYASRVSARHARAFVLTMETVLESLVGQDPLTIGTAITPGLGTGSPLPVFQRTASWPGYQARIASTLDAALWDIRGKAANMPVHRLLGGFRDRVPCYASWRIEPGTTEAGNLSGSAQYLVESGFRSMKFHVRHLDDSGVLAHMRELRTAAGPDIGIMVDNYQAWDLKHSVRMARALAEFNPYWLEDPMPLDDCEGMRQLRDSTEVRICAGEQYRDVASFRRLLEQRAVDIAMVDLDLGITGFIKVAHLAEAFGVPVVSHLASEIMAQCVAAVPNGLTVEYIPYAQPFLQEPMRVQDGEIVLPQQPGLGISFDDEAVQKLAV